MLADRQFANGVTVTDSSRSAPQCLFRLRESHQAQPIQVTIHLRTLHRILCHWAMNTEAQPVEGDEIDLNNRVSIYLAFVAPLWGGGVLLVSCPTTPKGVYI